jgi:hypothetical protein
VVLDDEAPLYKLPALLEQSRLASDCCCWRQSPTKSYLQACAHAGVLVHIQLEDLHTVTQVLGHLCAHVLYYSWCAQHAGHAAGGEGCMQTYVMHHTPGSWVQRTAAAGAAHLLPS